MPGFFIFLSGLTLCSLLLGTAGGLALKYERKQAAVRQQPEPFHNLPASNRASHLLHT